MRSAMKRSVAITEKHHSHQNHMKKKLLEIVTVDFDVMGQPLTGCSSDNREKFGEQREQYT
jgi:hypothetical protein